MRYLIHDSVEEFKSRLIYRDPIFKIIITNPAKNVLVFRLWKKLCIAVKTFESIILFAGDCSVKKLVFDEKRSVNDLRVIGGISGDEAIDPGAPPTCGFGAPDAAGAAAAIPLLVPPPAFIDTFGVLLRDRGLCFDIKDCNCNY
jgi:hypothetical protein